MKLFLALDKVRTAAGSNKRNPPVEMWIIEEVGRARDLEHYLKHPEILSPSSFK
jgi:hypothetical protein